MRALKMDKRKYQICNNCIMDTSDSLIKFDGNGFCDYCNNYFSNILPTWNPNGIGSSHLKILSEKIKKDGDGKDYDCIIGISGGIDSSYVAYLAKEIMGLRALLYHVDAGWNSSQSVHNIESIVEGLGLELFTEVVNWNEMRDLQLSFFKSGVPHLDTPQDHAFFAGLYNYAAKKGIKYILTGANYSTECVREPLEWHYHASDLAQLLDIHAKHGSNPLKKFPTAGIFKYKIYYRIMKGIQVIKPLNYVSFKKQEAIDLLVKRFGWEPYEHKHYESRFTKFFEGFWLLKRFNYDKRRAHFSSLILTGQLSRAEALERISRDPYDKKMVSNDIEYIATKLRISVDELLSFMDLPKSSYRKYKNHMKLIQFGAYLLRLVGVQKALLR